MEIKNWLFIKNQSTCQRSPRAWISAPLQKLILQQISQGNLCLHYVILILSKIIFVNKSSFYSNTDHGLLPHLHSRSHSAGGATAFCFSLLLLLFTLFFFLGFSSSSLGLNSSSFLGSNSWSSLISIANLCLLLFDLQGFSSPICVLLGFLSELLLPISFKSARISPSFNAHGASSSSSLIPLWFKLWCSCSSWRTPICSILSFHRMSNSSCKNSIRVSRSFFLRLRGSSSSMLSLSGSSSSYFSGTLSSSPLSSITNVPFLLFMFLGCWWSSSRKGLLRAFSLIRRSLFSLPSKHSMQSG